jgi:hypothetical protein
VYTCWSSGYHVHATLVPNAWQGGISLVLRASDLYEFEEVEMRGPNVLSFQLVLGTTWYYIMGCYILPNDLTTLMHIEQAWLACPSGCTPIMLRDLNVNLAAPCDERKDDCQAGGCHKLDQHVQPFLSALGKKFQQPMDLADEKGEVLGLLKM